MALYDQCGLTRLTTIYICCKSIGLCTVYIISISLPSLVRPVTHVNPILSTKGITGVTKTFCWTKVDRRP